MDSPDDLTGPVNLGNPGESTMIELAETLLELTGSRSALVHEPRIALRDGLKPTIEYFECLLRGVQGGCVSRVVWPCFFP